MKITPQQSRKCLYPTIAAVTAIVSGVSCSQPAAGQALPGEPPAVQETQPSSKPKDKFNRPKQHVQALPGEPPAVQETQPSSKPKDKFNRPKQHVIGKARVDTPPSNEDESAYIKWDEQMTVGYISPL